MRTISEQKTTVKAYDGPKNGVIKAVFINDVFQEIFYEPEDAVMTDEKFYSNNLDLLKEIYQGIGDFFLDQRIEANYTSDDKLPKKQLQK